MSDFFLESLAAAVMRSAAPQAMTSAAMLASLGMASGMLRRQTMVVYRLVETAGDGRKTCEEFPAPDDISALERAAEAASGVSAELWRGGDMIRRWATL